jgi:hypothetical protein
MKTKYSLLLALTFLLCGLVSFVSVNEDQGKKILMESFLKYKNASSMNLSFDMEVVPKDGKMKIEQTFKGVVRSEGRFYYSSVMGRTNLNNGDFNLTVDDNNKMIICSPAFSDNDLESFASKIVLDKETLDEFDIRLISQVNNLFRIEIKDSQQGITIFYTIDGTSKLMTSYESVYSNSESSGLARVMIRYTKSELNVNLDKSVFSADAIVKKSGKKITPIGKYASYQIVNRLN